MTIIGYDETPIVQYEILSNEQRCKLYHDKTKYDTGYNFIGYYLNDQEEICVTQKYRNNFIKNKDQGNRAVIFFWIGFAYLYLLLIIFCAIETLFKFLIMKYYNIDIDYHPDQGQGRGAPKYKKVPKTDIGLHMNLIKQIDNNSCVVGPNMKDLCAYCTEELGDGKRIVSLPCAHWFHHECLDIAKEHAKNNFKCPTCQSEV